MQQRWLVREGTDPIRLRTWFHPEIRDLAKDYLDALNHYIEFYSGWIGEYPLGIQRRLEPAANRFRHARNDLPGHRRVAPAVHPPTSLGHEVLHNWWGNGVYTDYETGNWSEGLTTFMADYTYKEQESAQAAREMRLSWLRDLAALPQARRPLRYAHSSPAHGSSQIIGYDKAAFVFLMLRDRLGTEPSIARYALSGASSASDARAGWICAMHSSRAAAFNWRPSSSNGLRAADCQSASTAQRRKKRIRVTVAQTEPVYVLQVPLVLESRTGRETHVVELSALRQEFVIDTTSAPTAVALDPDLRLARRLDSKELPPILRQVMIDAGTVLVVATSKSEFQDAAQKSPTSCWTVRHTS